MIQNISEIKPPKNPLIFIGFNALTKAEEVLLKHFITNFKAEVLWDVDDYYMNNENQEAGYFLRKYSKDLILGKTFNKTYKNRFNNKKNIVTTGVFVRNGTSKIDRRRGI